MSGVVELDSYQNRPAAPATTPPSDTTELQAVIEEAKRGDRQAFATLYRSHVNLVYRYLAYRLPNKTVAEDLTAEVFVRALRKIGDFQWRGVEFSAWLLRIARNVLLDHLKSAGNRLEVIGVEGTEYDRNTVPGSDTEALNRLDRETLYKALNTLRPEHQEVLYLRFLQGLSTLEVAQVMTKSEGAIRVLQFRALKALLRVLKTMDESVAERAEARQQQLGDDEEAEVDVEMEAAVAIDVHGGDTG